MRCRKCAPMPEEVREAADLLERRWTVSIIWASHSGAVRFGEFMQALGSIPPATLTVRLVELEQAGLLPRGAGYARPPPSPDPPHARRAAAPGPGRSPPPPARVLR